MSFLKLEKTFEQKLKHQYKGTKSQLIPPLNETMVRITIFPSGIKFYRKHILTIFINTLMVSLRGTE